LAGNLDLHTDLLTYLLTYFRHFLTSNLEYFGDEDNVVIVVCLTLTQEIMDKFAREIWE